MAKILFFNLPAHGHVNATLPLVAELVRRGHEVIYYCGDDFQRAIEKTGASFRPYPQSDMKTLTVKISAAIVKNMVNVTPLLLNAAESITPFALAEIELEQPDVLMHDSIAIWGRVTAHVSGIPNIVTYSNLALEGIELDINWRTMTQFALGAVSKIPAIILSSRRLRKMYGSDALKPPFFPVKGTKNIVFMARAFHPPTDFVDESFVFVGPSIEPKMREESVWETINTDRPLVYISLGTINNQNMTFYQTVFEAFAEAPIQVVMSVGHSTNIQQLQPVPPHFMIKNSVPQLKVLQQADVFITHGGMNSVQEGLYYGVPEIVVPQQIEQLINGVQVAKLGVGILIGDTPPLGHITSSDLRGALDTVLHDPRYKTSANRMKEASRAAGGYMRAADEVETVLQNQRR